MYLVYASRTKNIERIVEKIDIAEDRKINISEDPERLVDGEYCLLTYSDLLGEIPEVVGVFLERNWGFLKYVAGSGNRNFGKNFCGAAKKISEKYGVPIVAEFELSGDRESIDKFKRFMEKGAYEG